MLKIRTMPILLKIAGKLDLNPIIATLKEADLFDEPSDGKNALVQLKNLSAEKAGILGMKVVSAIAPQLGRIADDIPPLVAAYKSVSLEEAMELDAAEVINEIINDDGVRCFFKNALRKKLVPGA